MGILSKLFGKETVVKKFLDRLGGCKDEEQLARPLEDDC